MTTNFACSNGVCEVGPGNVGMAFGAELIGTGGPPTSLPDCPYIMSVVSGSLPPGLQLGGVCGNIIEGTPTQSGTYPFTVQVTSLGSDTLGVVEPSSTQQLTITIGTGSSDRMLAGGAHYNGHLFQLSVGGFDANGGLTYTVIMSPHTVLFSAQAPTWSDGNWDLVAKRGDPCPAGKTCTLTVTNSLGSSATVSLPPATY